VDTEDDICLDAYVDGERFGPWTFPHDMDLFSLGPEELALVWDWRWQPGQQLRISFLDGSRELRLRVERYARIWLDHANLEFTFGNRPDAEIRITFTGTGSRSLVGTNAVRQRRDQPTMWLGGIAARHTDGLRVQRTVLHEFGHAIGCIHEQASPASSIPWDEAKVYQEFRRLGWDDKTIRSNILVRYSPRGTRFSKYDAKSIMQYPVSSKWTKNGFTIGWNTELSRLDKSFISRMYPR
jgi:hypothetical protein